jgi:ABC-2 type transport system permease protein
MSSAFQAFAAAFKVGRADYAMFWDWKSLVFGWFLRVLCLAAMWSMTAALIGNPRATDFLVIGNAVFAGAGATLWVVAASVWDRLDGTYDVLRSSAVNYPAVVVGRTFVWVINGTFFCAASLALLPPLLTAGRLLWVPSPIQLVILLLISLSSFTFALCLGLLATRASQLRNTIAGVAAALMATFCGVNVPMEFWSPSVQLVAALLPLTAGLQGLREAIDGNSVSWRFLWGELMVALLWGLLFRFFVHRLSESERKSGIRHQVT